MGRVGGRHRAVPLAIAIVAPSRSPCNRASPGSWHGLAEAKPRGSPHLCAVDALDQLDFVKCSLVRATIDPAGLSPPANVRVERFVPHAPVLDRAVCVVCHAGMGITQKALAHGVPVVAVPFGRDQPEVARRVEVAHAGVRLPARRLNPERLRASVEQARRLTPGAQRIAAAFQAAGGPVAAGDALEQLIPASKHQPA